MCVLFAFIFQMFSALLCGRTSEPRFPRDPVLYNVSQILFRMLRWLAEHPVLPPSIFSSYIRWRSWAQEHGLTVFPASPFHCAIYLRHSVTEAKTASPMESAVHSIAWFHLLGGELSPSDHPLVKSTLAGAQRLLAHQTTKEEPITVSQLEQLAASKANSMAFMYNIRSVVICLIAFAGFFRFDELARLVRSDVKIENDMLKLFIQSSKTDQYRDGAGVVVASSRKATCPVAMMNRYLDRAGLSCNSPLFCELSKTKCDYKPKSKGLSYSRLRELVLEAF